MNDQKTWKTFWKEVGSLNDPAAPELANEGWEKLCQVSTSVGDLLDSMQRQHGVLLTLSESLLKHEKKDARLVSPRFKRSRIQESADQMPSFELQTRTPNSTRSWETLWEAITNVQDPQGAVLAAEGKVKLRAFAQGLRDLQPTLVKAGEKLMELQTVLEKSWSKKFPSRELGTTHRSPKVL